MGCLNVQRCRQQSQLVIYQIMYSMNVLALVTESDGNIFAHRCNMHIDAGHNVFPLRSYDRLLQPVSANSA